MFVKDWVLDIWEEINNRRYVALLLLSLVPFGVFFAYDSLGALADFLEADLGLSHTDIGLVYSAYSLPNCVGGLFYGLAIDRYGTSISMMVGHAAIFVGCLCVALASGLPLVLIGRLIFGIGGESFIVAQRKLIGIWFRSSKLSLAYTVSYCIPLLSTFLCFQLLPYIADTYSLRRALLICLFFCGGAWFFNIVYIYFEKYYPYKDEEENMETGNAAEAKSISWASIKQLPYSYWMVCVITLCMYSTTWPFVALAVDMYSTKWGYSPEEAGRIASIFGIEGVVMGPLSSFFFDRFGYRVSGMIVSCMLIVMSFLMLGLTNITPVYATIILGLCLSITPATTYPCFPLIVPSHLLGTAFGILNLFQNGGLAVFPTIFGGLAERSEGDFTNSCVCFACIALFGMCVSVALKINDTMHNNLLDSVHIVKTTPPPTSTSSTNINEAVTDPKAVTPTPAGETQALRV